MITVALDASTYRGTVAVLDGERVVLELAAAMRDRERELLMPAVDQALRDAGVGLADVERIVCGAGPGSFTSLRIAASIAKGLAVGRSIPLFAVPSLALIVAGNVGHELASRSPRHYLAAMDALRGESYVAEFEHDGRVVRPLGETRLAPTDDVASIAERVDARPVGPEQPDGWLPRARGVALLQALLDDYGPVDVGTWEPVYGRLAEAQVKWEAAHGRPLPR